MDNGGAHKPGAIVARIETAGARAVFLPPYSPEFNPIEECWSQLKNQIKKFNPRTRDELDVAVACAMDRITASNAVGWFRRAGYATR